MTQWGGHFVRNYDSLPSEGTGCGWSPAWGDEIGPVTLSQFYTNIIQLEDCTWKLTVACEGEGGSFIMWQGIKTGWPKSRPAGKYYRIGGCDTRRVVTIVDCPASFSSSEVPQSSSEPPVYSSSEEIPPESSSEVLQISSSEIPQFSSSEVAPLVVSSSEVPPAVSSSEVPAVISSSEVPPAVSSSEAPFLSSEPVSSEQPSEIPSWSLWSPPSDVSDSIPPDSSFGPDSSDFETCCDENPVSCCIKGEGEMWSACYGPVVRFPLAISGSCGGPDYWEGTITLPPALLVGCDGPAYATWEIICEGPPPGRYYIYIHYNGKTVKQHGFHHCECSGLVEYELDIRFNVKLWPNVGCDCIEYPSGMELRFYCNPCSYSSSSLSGSASSASASDSSLSFSIDGPSFSCPTGEEIVWDPEQGLWLCKPIGQPVAFPDTANQNDEFFNKNSTINPWFM